ncbi:MAG: SIS domain-containing protein [Rhodospirillales bacterium]|jgi:D-sedoheptulose 7-phosphate isomerase|nr:SIS domain-containing protein [Rhodospirillales bacterium]MDP6774108.1 SIS domain-containing protein [Rhodospirillales bacterium]
MDVDAFFASELDEHAAVLAASRQALGGPFKELVGACAAAARGGGKIVFFGNGGSAADCQHLATELTVRYKQDRAPIAALALTTDTSALTAIGNDFGFDDLFARQIEALVHGQDVVIGISTSGQSENVIRGLKAARALGAVAAGFGGKDGGRMQGLAAPLLVVPSATTSRIQEMHITLGQMLCGALEIELGLV